MGSCSIRLHSSLLAGNAAGAGGALHVSAPAEAGTTPVVQLHGVEAKDNTASVSVSAQSVYSRSSCVTEPPEAAVTTLTHTTSQYRCGARSLAASLL